MSERTHLGILKQGAAAWNSWRLDNPGVLPQLSGEDLSELFDSNLAQTNLKMASLRGADLSGANLSGANLGRAKLVQANI